MFHLCIAGPHQGNNYVNSQVIRSIHKCYIFNTDRRAKTHDFVVSLTISQPISCSHVLATDFSRFLEKSNSKIIFWSCRVGFQARYR